MKSTIITLVCSIFIFYIPSAHALRPSSALKKYYDASCQTPSDIFEHLPHLRNLASECSSAVEIGVRDIVSTWSILQGLSENKSGSASYIGIDLISPSKDKLNHAERLAKYCGIEFYFMEQNSLFAEIPYTDLLFIDSLHTYAHLTTELERYADKIGKYIALHDTSAPWGEKDEAYHGDYSEYPSTIDLTKQGLWTAVLDFLDKHPEWDLDACYLNNHGFTILKRIKKES